MLIKKWMSKPVISIESDDSLLDASKLFREKIISMLPVVKHGELVGIVTDGDIKKASPSDATSLDIYELIELTAKLKIKKIMSKPVVTTTCDHTVDEIAGIMLSKNISGMPVVSKSGRMEGIITKSDVFRCLVSFTGISNKGQIFAFRIKDIQGGIKSLTNIIRQKGGRLSSIMTSYDDIDKKFREIYIHTFDIDPSVFDELVENLNGAAKMLYAADIGRNIRITY